MKLFRCGVLLCSVVFSLPVHGQQIIDTITIPPFVFGLAVNESTNKIYVTGTGYTNAAVTVIDGATDQITATIQWTNGTAVTLL